MKKSEAYETAVRTFNSSKSALAITSIFPFSSLAEGRVETSIILGFLWLIKLHMTMDDYNKIKDSSEYRELMSIYEDIMFSLILNMKEIDICGLSEKYLYLRYLIENDYLSIPKHTPTVGGIRYCKKALEKPLCLNNHAIKSTWAVVLEDLIRSSTIATATIYGKVVRYGAHTQDDEAICKAPRKVVDAKELTLKERIKAYSNITKYLTVAQEKGHIYYLNPTETEVFTKTTDDAKYLVSDKGTILRVLGKNKNYGAIEESLPAADPESLLAYKKYILEKIENNKDKIDNMHDTITPKLNRAEEIYKELKR